MAVPFQNKLQKNGRYVLGVIVPLVIYHVGALCTPFFFSWEGLCIWLTLHVLTGIGITVGFHRLLTHGAFQTYRWVKWGFAVLGGIAGQSHIRWWAMVHRMHHKWSDEDGDPHSPAHGFWWSHWQWITVKLPPEELATLERQFIPDLLKDRVLLGICRAEFPLNVLVGSSLFCGGWLYGGEPYMGISWFLWGYCLRIAAVLHITWAVNSIAHMWGYRNFPTNDTSRNNPVIAALSLGEGWHNNHHSSPSAANFKRRWWELDPGYQLIRLLGWCGLAWGVKEEHASP